MRLLMLHRQRLRRAACTLVGSSMLNVEPSPIAHSTQMRPSCISTMSGCLLLSRLGSFAPQRFHRMIA